MFDQLYQVNLHKNTFYIKRYLKFILAKQKRPKSEKSVKHHILPKARDFFPQFRDLKQNPWNVSYLTEREHYLAHYMLCKAFPGSSMSLAFYNMTNTLNKRHSKSYEKARLLHIEKLKLMTQSPERNKKISKALKNKPKSEDHKNKLRRKRPEWHGRLISEGMKKSKKICWKHDKERVALHSARVKARPPQVWTKDQKERMSKIKMGIKASEQTRKKMSETRKKMKWYNNGVNNLRSLKELEFPWKLGRLSK